MVVLNTWPKWVITEHRIVIHWTAELETQSSDIVTVLQYTYVYSVDTVTQC